MTLDQFYKVFIICHATGGGIALISGTISVIARKGNTWHKKSGLVFFYGMMIAGLSGIVASMIPDHINPFLFVVGIFSVYLVLSGYRALRFKKVREVRDIFWDKVIAGIMLTATVGMITYGITLILQGNTIGVVLIIFGLIGGMNAALDFKAFKDLKKLRKIHLRMHIGKISGGYIAAFTAFLITNQVLPSIVGWLLPTVLGSVFIAYWLRKTKVKKKTTIEKQ